MISKQDFRREMIKAKAQDDQDEKDQIEKVKEIFYPIIDEHADKIKTEVNRKLMRYIEIAGKQARVGDKRKNDTSPHGYEVIIDIHFDPIDGVNWRNEYVSSYAGNKICAVIKQDSDWGCSLKEAEYCPVSYLFGGVSIPIRANTRIFSNYDILRFVITLE